MNDWYYILFRYGRQPRKPKDHDWIWALLAIVGVLTLIAAISFIFTYS